MATQIKNTASLTFEYGENSGSVTSNTATTTLQDPFSVSKTSLGETYILNQYITYIITVKNNSTTPAKNVKITDNLGEFSPSSALSLPVAPLIYEDPAKLYIGGEYINNIEHKKIGNKIIFTICAIPAGSTAMIIYRALVNDFAPLELNGEIVNIITVSARNKQETQEVKNTIKVQEIADIKIIKTMTPNPVLFGGNITYNFSLYNYGNIEAKNVTLTDTFDPAPTAVSIKVDGNPLNLGEYSYLGKILNIPAFGSAYNISIPPATFSRDPLTNKVTTEPGIVTVTMKGKI